MSLAKVTAVIPAFQEAGRIAATIAGVLPYVDEVLVVDDASRDATAQEAQAAGARVVRQTVNQGYIAAIRRGFAEASGEIVVTIDADGEFPPQAIPDLVRPIQANEFDMMQGHRDTIPRLSERLLNWLANRKTFAGDSGTGLRALRTVLARQLHLRGMCICGIFALEVASLGGRIGEIPIRLQRVNKPRRIAWFHLRQIFFIIPWLLKK